MKKRQKSTKKPKLTKKQKMQRRRIVLGILSIVLLSLTTFYAQQLSAGKVSIIARQVASNLFGFIGNLHPSAASISDSETQPVDCSIIEPVIPEYSGKLIDTSLPVNVGKSEVFKTTISVENTGNTTWFSSDSGCKSVPIIHLGTDNQRDRESIFMTHSPEYDTGWLGANRIKMKTQRVAPGEVAAFEFWSKAPETDEIYVEYFTPVVEGVQWIEDATAKIQIRTGLYDITWEDKMPFVLRSRSLSDFNISEEKSILVDVSDQIMHLKVGDDILHTFPVSTGAYATPTPYGTTTIKFKQDVRIGGKWPHYVMPNFMWFRAGGYGIHSLPSLQNDGGTFWREAREHIQQRVSHGCIRLLPEDSDVVYNFGEPGTPITIQP